MLGQTVDTRAPQSGGGVALRVGNQTVAYGSNPVAVAIIDSNTGALTDSGNYGANQAGRLSSFQGQADRVVVVAVAPGTTLGSAGASAVRSDTLGRKGARPGPAGWASSEGPTDRAPGSSTRTASRPRATGG